MKTYLLKGILVGILCTGMALPAFAAVKKPPTKGNRIETIAAVKKPPSKGNRMDTIAAVKKPPKDKLVDVIA